MMPPGVPPILLFRTFVRNLPMTAAMHGWGGYELSRLLSLSRLVPRHQLHREQRPAHARSRRSSFRRRAPDLSRRCGRARRSAPGGCLPDRSRHRSRTPARCSGPCPGVVLRHKLLVAGRRSGIPPGAGAPGKRRKVVALSAASASIAPPRCRGLLARTPAGRPPSRASAVRMPIPDCARSSGNNRLDGTSSRIGPARWSIGPVDCAPVMRLAGPVMLAGRERVRNGRLVPMFVRARHDSGARVDVDLRTRCGADPPSQRLGRLLEADRDLD